MQQISSPASTKSTASADSTSTAKPLPTRTGWRPRAQYFACNAPDGRGGNLNEHITSQLEPLVKIYEALAHEHRDFHWKAHGMRKSIGVITRYGKCIRTRADAIETQKKYGLGKKTVDKVL